MTRAVAEADPIESALLAGAVAALRRRATRQERVAADWTANGSRGAVIRQGEAAVALRIAQALKELADELEQGGAPFMPDADVPFSPERR
jgi:hypothetical protein